MKTKIKKSNVQVKVMRKKSAPKTAAETLCEVLRNYGGGLQPIPTDFGGGIHGYQFHMYHNGTVVVSLQLKQRKDGSYILKGEFPWWLTKEVQKAGFQLEAKPKLEFSMRKDTHGRFRVVG